MRKRLNHLYGPSRVEHCLERMVALIGRYGIGLEGFSELQRWDETSSVLITYGDMIQREDEEPLQVLKRFADQHLFVAINSIHILPFCPYSSDDGFSVIDYRKVNPALGDWDDVQEIGSGFKLMFDLVLNHVSRKSKWFADYVSNIAPYRDYFITADPETDLSAVTPSPCVGGRGDSSSAGYHDSTSRWCSAYPVSQRSSAALEARST